MPVTAPVGFLCRKGRFVRRATRTEAADAKTAEVWADSTLPAILLLARETDSTLRRGSMLLAIDIGNTNVTLGLYRRDDLGPHWRIATGEGKTSDEYGMLLVALIRQAGISSTDVRAIAIASVVPHLTGAFKEACRKYFRCDPLVVGGQTRTGVHVKYDDPGQVGADRIVNAVAVQRLYGVPACIVDFGTATTFDAVSSEGDYLGGAIAPGIGIASDALFQRTAKLPKVDLNRPPAAIGRNTIQSLQSGLLFGYVGLVEGMVVRFRAELGPETKVVGTGGLAEVIARETEVISIVAPWLTLDGLKLIHQLNSNG